jgi:RNA polymerase sigma factor (sigma-70 family)
MESMEDSALLRQYCETQSEDAFATLVTRYINLVHSAALRQLGNPQQAEEVTQAVFILLAKKAGGLRHEKALSSWLFRTAHLVSKNFVRSEMRRHHREQEAFMQSSSNEPETNAWQQMSPLLDNAVAALGEKDRQAILLRFFQKKSLSDVGVAAGIGEEAAKKRVSRALEKLRNYFSKRGVNSTTAIIGENISAYSVQVAPGVLAKTVAAAAVAKGVASSTSTLTLVKGALKIMAWTKVKTAIVTGVVILATTVATLVVVDGYWHGIGSRKERLKLPTGNVTPMITYGYSHNMVVLASDGSLWTWGEERLGWPVLGLKDPKIDHTTRLRRIGDATNWISVAAGDYNCLAIKADGTLWGWGMNLWHQLGDGTTNTQSTPVQSVPGNDWKQAATEGGTSYGLKKGGTLWTWGRSPFGDYRLEDNVDAVQIGISTNWTRIWAGGIQAVGLQSDGSLWFWGGTLTGDNKDNNAIRVPTCVSADTNWTDVCFGYSTVLGVKADGTLWSWGKEANFYTQAPDDRSNAIPMQVGTDTDWVSCSSGPGCFYHLLRKKDGSLWAIDASEHRIIKKDGVYQPIKIGQIDWQKDIAAFAAGADDIGVILTSDGQVWTWGRVIGQFSKADYNGPNGQVYPKPTVITKPWQLTNVVSMD